MNFLDMDEQIYSDKQSVDLNTEQITGSSEASDSAFADTLADILARAEKEDLSVEEAFAVLEQIVQNMEDERISLESASSATAAGGLTASKRKFRCSAAKAKPPWKRNDNLPRRRPSPHGSGMTNKKIK